jgi:predicted nucleic acid-binding Zn ribbon protein
MVRNPVVNVAEPHDTCLKCGRPVPLGVSLCEQDNPGRIKSPSATQVHGTIVIGVLAGFLLLLLVFRLGSGGAGPFSASVVGFAPRTDGSLSVVVRVTNSGTRAAGASCRISAGGAPDFRDYVFFSEPIAASQTRQFERTIPAVPNGAALQPVSLVVRCT